MDRIGQFLIGLTLAAGLVVSTVIATRALVQIKSQDTIEVTGSAKRRIHSDQITWSCRISARATDMKSAYRALAQSVPRVSAYLEAKGVPRSQLVVSSVSTTALHPRDKEGQALEDQIIGYTMSQAIRVDSTEVDKIAKLSRAATELINEGIDIESQPPEYRYTKLGDLKVLMLAEAAKDTKERAQQIADSTGAHLGPLRSARMGVIQINPADSTETEADEHVGVEEVNVRG